MSVRNTNRASAQQLMQGATSPHSMQDLSAGMGDLTTEDSAKFSLQQPNDPLTRTLNVNIKGNLSDLTGNPSLSVWQPTVEALNTIFQQSKYHNLKGDMAKKGDLKSVILHSISVKAVQSDFPFGKRQTFCVFFCEEPAYASTDVCVYDSLRSRRRQDYGCG